MSPWNLRRSLPLALSLLALPAAAPAQRLRRASEAVHTGSSDRGSGSSSSEPRRSSSPSSSSGWGRSFWQRSRYFLPFPYAWGYAGYDVPQVDLTRSPRSVAVVASLDGGIGLSSIGRGGVSLRVLGSVLEFELRYTIYAEPSDGGTFWVGLGRYRGAVALVDGADARMRLFGALLHWIDDAGSEFGGEGGLGLDVFPGAPWVLSFDLSGGLVGRSAIVGLRGTLGYLVGPVEFLLGWQHESVIPTVSGPSVDLSGPLVGVRLWR
jgi:hypothetical protein